MTSLLLFHKNRMTTREITLLRIDNVSMRQFLIDIMLILKAIKSHFKGPYDKQNLIFVVIQYEIYETRRWLVSQITYEMTIRVRSSMSIQKFCQFI